MGDLLFDLLQEKEDEFPFINKLGSVVPATNANIYTEEYTRGLRGGMDLSETFDFQGIR